jgi:hypothetical protein
MCGNAVGTGGPDAEASEEAVVAGEPRRDDEAGGAGELAGGGELAATADDAATGALGGFDEAVGPATCADVEVQALSPNAAAITTAAARHPVRFTYPVCRLG